MNDAWKVLVDGALIGTFVNFGAAIRYAKAIATDADTLPDASITVEPVTNAQSRASRRFSTPHSIPRLIRSWPPLVSDLTESDVTALYSAHCESVGDLWLSQGGTRLRRYEILSRVSAGELGEAYEARNMKLGLDVAIKILP